MPEQNVCVWRHDVQCSTRPCNFESIQEDDCICFVLICGKMIQGPFWIDITTIFMLLLKCSKILLARYRVRLCLVWLLQRNRRNEIWSPSTPQPYLLISLMVYYRTSNWLLSYCPTYFRLQWHDLDTKATYLLANIVLRNYIFCNIFKHPWLCHQIYQLLDVIGERFVSSMTGLSCLMRHSWGFLTAGSSWCWWFRVVILNPHKVSALDDNLASSGATRKKRTIADCCLVIPVSPPTPSSFCYPVPEHGLCRYGKMQLHSSSHRHFRC